MGKISMSSLALFVTVMVLALPAISKNQEMVCIQNSASSDSASQCVYRGKAGEKGQKGDKGRVNEDSVGKLSGKQRHFECFYAVYSACKTG